MQGSRRVGTIVARSLPLRRPDLVLLLLARGAYEALKDGDRAVLGIAHAGLLENDLVIMGGRTQVKPGQKVEPKLLAAEKE